MNDYVIPHYPTIIHFNENWQPSSGAPEPQLYHMVLVTRGSVQFHIGNQQFSATEGEIILIAPEEPYQLNTTAFSAVSIAFSLEQSLDSAHLPLHYTQPNLCELRGYFEQIRQAYQQQNASYELVCAVNLSLMLHHMCYENRKNVQVEQIKDYILSNYMRHLDMPMIAEHMGISTARCAALFRRYENQTIDQYTNQIRINASLDPVLMGLPVQQVAQSVGFKNIYYFSNTFKKVMGVSPLNYRKQHEQQNHLAVVAV